MTSKRSDGREAYGVEYFEPSPPLMVVKGFRAPSAARLPRWLVLGFAGSIAALLVADFALLSFLGCH